MSWIFRPGSIGRRRLRLRDAAPLTRRTHIPYDTRMGECSMMTRGWAVAAVCLVSGVCVSCASPVAPTWADRPLVPCAGGAPCPSPFPSGVLFEGNTGVCLPAAEMWRWWGVDAQDGQPRRLDVIAYRDTNPGCDATYSRQMTVESTGGTVATRMGVLRTVFLLQADLRDAFGVCGRAQYELRLDGLLVARALVNSGRACEGS